MKRTLLYSVNSSSAHQNMLIRSLESLRFYSPEIPVTVSLFGRCPRRFVQRLSDLSVRLVQRGGVNAALAWSIKWLALRDVQKFQTVFFVDADTCFFGPAETLLARHQERDFYATLELRMMPKQAQRQGLDAIIRPTEVNRLRREFGVRTKTIYNSSMMVFNHRCHSKLVEKVPVFLKALDRIYQLRDQIFIDPGWSFVAEELAASLVLAATPEIRRAQLKGRLATHFSRLIRARTRSAPGLVMHIGNQHYDQWLRELK